LLWSLASSPPAPPPRASCQRRTPGCRPALRTALAGRQSCCRGMKPWPNPIPYARCEPHRGGAKSKCSDHANDDEHHHGFPYAFKRHPASSLCQSQQRLLSRSVYSINPRVERLYSRHHTPAPNAWFKKSATIARVCFRVFPAAVPLRLAYFNCLFASLAVRVVVTHPCTPYTAATRSTTQADARPQQTRRHPGERLSKQCLSGLHTALRCGDRQCLASLVASCCSVSSQRAALWRI
jgi:hypothetical protein